MTASPAITANEIPDLAWLEMGHRESAIAGILADACSYDREIKIVERAVDERHGAARHNDGSFGPFPLRFWCRSRCTLSTR